MQEKNTFSVKGTLGTLLIKGFSKKKVRNVQYWVFANIRFPYSFGLIADAAADACTYFSPLNSSLSGAMLHTLIVMESKNIQT